MTIRRILHPTDFSSSAHGALIAALDFAGSFDAELLVAHVAAEGIHDAARARLLQRLREETSSLGNATEVPIGHALLEAHTPSSAITAYAKKRNVDLIVLGKHGLRPLRRLLLGSVAFGVLHRAHCDVLVVPDMWKDRKEGSILVPLDLRDRSIHVARSAAILARQLEADVELLHVIDLPERLQLRGEMLEVRVLTDVVSARLNEIADASGADVPMIVEVESGHPAGRILRFVEEHDICMLVLASSGMSPDERIRNYPQEQETHEELRLLISRVTERLSTYAPVPVWVIKEFPDEALRPEPVQAVYDPAVTEI